jgi:hypothetical protein
MHVHAGPSVPHLAAPTHRKVVLLNLDQSKPVKVISTLTMLADRAIAKFRNYAAARPICNAAPFRASATTTGCGVVPLHHNEFHLIPLNSS